MTEDHSFTTAIETELKLAVPVELLARLERHPALQSAAQASAHRLHAIYYDTRTCDLWAHGLALRVRRDGHQWTQTLKGGGSADAGLHRRMELEVPVPGPAPEPALFDATDLGATLVALTRGKKLERVCSMRFDRSARLLELAPDVVIEASLDRGHIRSGKHTLPLCELELELKAGTPAALYDCAAKLLATLPLTLENRSKAARGYALYRGAPSAPVKAVAIALQPAFTASDAFKTIVRSSLAHLQANERGMQDEADPEYLHQLRVAVRRLRSAFSLFAPMLGDAAAPLTGEMMWLAHAWGPARDWDVFMEETLTPVGLAFPEHAGLREYGQRFSYRRQRARRNAGRAIASRRYQRFLMSMGAWLEHEGWRDQATEDAARLAAQPIREYTREVLAARYARVRKRGRRLAQRTPEELHRLRIAIKKLRYASHFFSGLYDADAVAGLEEQLARLQDVLGALNDAATVRELVDGVTPVRTSREIAEARGILLGWSRGRAELMKHDLGRAWKAFRSRDTYW